jgi:hypothetical protein
MICRAIFWICSWIFAIPQAFECQHEHTASGARVALAGITTLSFLVPLRAFVTNLLETAVQFSERVQVLYLYKYNTTTSMKTLILYFN